MSEDNTALITLTADIAAAYVANNALPVSEVAVMIENVHGALAGLCVSGAVVTDGQEPAVSIRSSVQPDHIICLEDGKRAKMLKGHLMRAHGMTPDEYRAKWNLPSTYPLVAPNYSKERSALAVRIGLGRKKTSKA